MDSPEIKLRQRSFAVYTGPSMNPTLREPELLEIIPYGNRLIEIGDVVCFRSPVTGRQIVHRIIRLTPEGIATQGDNNSREDQYLLKSEDIFGRVAAAWCGSRRRAVAGGRRGVWIGRGGRWKSRLDKKGANLLHPLYYALTQRGGFSHFLPQGLRPRVVIFKINGQNQFGLFIRKRLVGRYDKNREQWFIRHPFRLLVNVNRIPMVP